MQKLPLSGKPWVQCSVQNKTTASYFSYSQITCRQEEWMISIWKKKKALLAKCFRDKVTRWSLYRFQTFSVYWDAVWCVSVCVSGINFSFTWKRETICKNTHVLIQNPKGSPNRRGTKAKRNQREKHNLKQPFIMKGPKRETGDTAVELLYLWSNK